MKDSSFLLSVFAETEGIERINLDEYVKRGLQDVYYIRIQGDKFKPLVCDGDLLVVERSFNPLNGDLIVANINDQWLIKEFRSETNGLYLVTEKNSPKPKKLKKEFVLGVVVYIVHKVGRYEMQRIEQK